MASSFSLLPLNVRDKFVRMLDSASIASLSLASTEMYRLAYPWGTPHASSQEMSTPASPADSPASSSPFDHGSPVSIDTEMTDADSQGETDDEDAFKLTDDMSGCVSLMARHEERPALLTLPNELQMHIFGYLDAIDSVCFGLSCTQSFLVYRALYSKKVPLSTRRVGPNRLEFAWEMAGKQQCKQCGMNRCELWRHLKTWMPANLEYCNMKAVFGSAATSGASATCHRGKPSKPNRCGRHPARTVTIHEDDIVAMDTQL